MDVRYDKARIGNVPVAGSTGMSYDAQYTDKAGEYSALNACLKNLKQGDTLYVERESFLADTVAEAITVLSTLAQRGVNVYLERKQQLVKSESSPFKKLNGDLAQAVIGFRKAFTKLRQIEGYRKAKAEGRLAAPGKRPLPANFEEVKKRWLEKKITIIEAAAECEMAVATFWTRCKKA